MTEITTSALLAELHQAAGIVTGVVAKIDDAGVKAPSELPGWTRGHVLAHIAGIANAMARQLEYAARGETIELYDGGYEGRTKAIELAAGHTAAEHQAEVGEAVARALAAFDGLPDSGWATRITYRDGTVLDGGLALWRELVIHATDLGMGRGPETWSRTFCEHLFDFLSARVPAEQKFVLQPLALPQLVIGSGRESVSITGMITDIAAWLAGRTPTLGSLRAVAAADGVDLPSLLPWPSGVPAK
ncbi:MULTISPECIES: maleylpyruvate isomerase family mycothiol-dependent enzyme [Arthrobacter]|uniref:Maleylpyruvate isomerase family mycothiol-dependent enzyme n=1 Tax=Arthrobacter terricola TaxID=2547396 RepID=A0A4R5KYM6_9MICC|nr:MULTISPECIES: maleylpyruvate isomerase family mycothiol-dependent enzyme [Arthrobacter]MBT8160230.1 maleylpyruvate isomerase family mycothiol-dependent enzyme [Arthrobacter sp. GN70]TDG01220.1 maleylpyruvate isomerase family mycothiol-dependent enzyme [Arthrobacter terricola]